MLHLTDNALAVHGSVAMLVIALSAAWHDWFYWRIPNRLLAAGCAAGLMLAAFAPGGIGLSAAIAGLITGFALIWPLHLAGGIGAGDVKLMATLGLLVGPRHITEITLASFLIGGLWSVVMLLGRTTTGTLIFARLSSLYQNVPLPERQPPPQHRSVLGVIPYGVVIALAAVVLILIRDPN